MGQATTDENETSTEKHPFPALQALAFNTPQLSPVLFWTAVVLVSCVVPTFAGDKAVVKPESNVASAQIDFGSEDPEKARELAMQQALADARVLLAIQDFDGAQEIIETALRNFPGDSALAMLRDNVLELRQAERSRRELARAYRLYRDGRYDEALMLLEEISRYGPIQEEALSLLRVVQHLNRERFARAEFESPARERADEAAERERELKARADAAAKAELRAEAEASQREREIHERRPSVMHQPPAIRRRRTLLLAFTITVMGLAVALFQWISVHPQTVSITSPADGAAVGQIQTIRGTGWQPDLNNYLVVEPIDGLGARFIQGQITSHVWTMVARFGNAGTPSGVRFRVYVVSTSSKLPTGELLVLPHDSRVSQLATVTLQK